MSGSFAYAIVFLSVLTALGLAGCSGLVSGNSNTGNPPLALSITNVQVPSTTTSASQIVWTTNIASDSAVDYGTSTSYGFSTPVDSAMVTSHQVTVSGLVAGTTYYYQVRSTDSKTNHASNGGHTFKTSGFSISGTITPTTGGSGATVTLSGTASATTTASSSGAYAFAGLPSGSYGITPTNSGYSFSPTSQNLTVSTANVTGVNFSASAVATAPTITTQPANQTVTAGQTATFMVVATGTTPLSYQWQKNGANIAGASVASYTTPATTAADSGATFAVVVSNSAGTVASAAATLTVNPATLVSIAVTPTNPSITKGTTQQFTATGTFSDSSTQVLSNAVWASGTAAVATISNTGLATAVGAGTSTISATVGSITGSTRLTVNPAPVAPTIATQPVSQTVPAGQTATFTVVAAGTAPLSYQWNRKGVVIAGATSASYTTGATSSSDNGAQFTVTVSNTAGTVTSNAVTLTVNAPQLSATPSSVGFGSVVTGTSSSLTVMLTNGGSASVTISQASVSGAGFSITGLTVPLTIGAGGNATFSVVFAPAAAGSANGSVSLVNNAPGSPLPISLSGTGVAATFLLGANPASLGFGNVTVGNNSPLSATLTNNGNSNVTISSVTTSGAGLSASGVASGTVLTPNQTITLNATFAPTTTGSVTGSISVASNATNSPAVIATTGSGVQPAGPQFYVSSTGNDANSGTSLSAPWRTVQKAMSSATPGSTVNMMAGTYNERLTLGVSGTTGNYITFQPYGFSIPAGGCGGYTGTPCGGDQVILDYAYLGTVTDTVPFLLISGKSYIRIQGLTFQNFTCTGAFQQGVRIDSGSAFVEFNYNKFLNNRNTYPLFDGTSALLHIRTWSPSNNITFYGNELGNIETVMSEALTFDGSGTGGVVVENNWIHDTDGIAIDAHGGANNYTVRGNRVEYASIKRDGTVWYNNPAAAIYNDGGNTGLIERNWVRYGGVAFEALSEPGQPATHDVTIRNNIVEHCQTGMVLGTWYSNTDGSSVSNINVFNNTFYGNNVGVNIRPMTSATVTWENNIFANNVTTYANALNWNPGNVNYNVYFGGGVGPGTNVLTLDPLLNNPSAGNFTLQSSSPAINAGDPNTSMNVAGTVDFAGNPRILGGQIDIGAYEMR